jgi:hypothetical protein
MGHLWVRLLIFGAGLLSEAAPVEDAQVALRLMKSSAEYHVSEPILFELALSSQSPKQYLANRSLRPGQYSGVAVGLSPTEGADDLQARNRTDLFQGGVSSPPRYLSEKPIAESADLTDWFRFKKPGHYRFSVVSREISRVAQVGQGMRGEAITVRSNVVEFDILPTDDVWQAQEQEELLRQLDDPSSPNVRELTEHRLVLLDTSRVIQEVVRRRLETADEADDEKYDTILSKSSQFDLIIPPFEAALKDPLSSNPSRLVPLLASLQVAKSLGDPPEISQEPAGQEAYNLAWQQRRRLYDDLVSTYSAVLIAGENLRPAPERVEIVYQAWQAAERQNTDEAHPSLVLDDLREKVLSFTPRLSDNEKHVVAGSLWTLIPHSKLKPVVDSLGLKEVEYWCQDWLTDCSAAILAEVQKPGSHLTYFDILHVAEMERPEFDSFLKKRLTSPNQMEDPFTGPQTASIVLRTGSRNLLGPVLGFLDGQPNGRGIDCEAEGFLLGYLFRVAPVDATRRLGFTLNDKQDRCASQLFRLLVKARHIEPIIPVAEAALDSANLQAAATAALFLGEKGPASSKLLLSRRLTELRDQWRDREDEISASFRAEDIRRQSADLEAYLVSALLHGRSWQVTEEERSTMQAGCFTEQCRQIALGRTSIGL